MCVNGSNYQTQVRASGIDKVDVVDWTTTMYFACREFVLSFEEPTQSLSDCQLSPCQ